MAAFEKIKSGFSEMDEILDHIRLGDNVVWQVSDIEEFRFFAEAFARQAVRDGRNIVYVRFAQHEPGSKYESLILTTASRPLPWRSMRKSQEKDATPSMCSTAFLSCSLSGIPI